jgi:UDP-glucuronate 4-epimerase
MRALVTGCAGFIGSHLTESLLRDGVDVLGVDCFNDNYGRPEKLRNVEHARAWDGFEFVPIDLARGELDDLVEESDVVFHLAAEPGVRPSWGRRFELYTRNNVLATQHLLEAAKRRPGTRFVFASSSSIYGQTERLPTPEAVIPAPMSPYGVTKLAGEHLCGAYHRNYRVDAVVLRYFSVYGPRQRPDMAFRIFCTAALERRPLEVLGDGRQTRDFTYVSDVVAATRAAAALEDLGGATLNVGGGSRAALHEVIARIGELAGYEPEVVHRPVQRGDVRDTAADVTAARARLGYVPRVELGEGLRTLWEWIANDSRRPLTRG